MAFGFVLIFLLFPTLRSSGGWGNRLGRAVDAVGIAVMVALTAYVAWNHIDIEWRAGDYYDYEIYFGVVIVLLVLEAARRTTGMALPIISVLFPLVRLFRQPLAGLVCPSRLQRIPDIQPALSFRGGCLRTSDADLRHLGLQLRSLGRVLEGDGRGPVLH